MKSTVPTKSFENAKEQFQKLGISLKNFPAKELPSLVDYEELLPCITNLDDPFFTRLWLGSRLSIHVLNQKDEVIQILASTFRSSFSLKEAVAMDETLKVSGVNQTFDKWVAEHFIKGYKPITHVDYVA